MRETVGRSLILLVWLLGAGVTSRAEDPAAGDGAATEELKPLWEIGVFGGAALIPHYRGSDEVSFYAVPLPYLVYRGDILRSDRSGVRGIFLQGQYFESNVSVFGNPPVDENNDAREGMPDLDPVFEMGPEIRWFLTGQREDKTLYMSTFVRGVISVDVEDCLGMGYEGLRGGVGFVYRNQCPLGDDTWSVGLGAFVDFVDDQFGGYYYDVPEACATADRDAYTSEGGYAGLLLSASALKQLTSTLAVSVYVRWENLDGTAFEESPLVRDRNNVILGCAVSESGRLVRVRYSDPLQE
jgi:outer membrane scaffolding protein for murein synthesis (MipA/OmpV family)